MPTVLVPTAYRGPTFGAAEIEVEGATIRECLEAVEVQFPNFVRQVIDDDGKVHNFVKLFLDDDEVPREDVDRAVDAGARVEILAAIAGG